MQGSQVMTFQAYLDDIHQKTGKTPDDFFALALEEGFCLPLAILDALVAAMV